MPRLGIKSNASSLRSASLENSMCKATKQVSHQMQVVVEIVLAVMIVEGHLSDTRGFAAAAALAVDRASVPARMVTFAQLILRIDVAKQALRQSSVVDLHLGVLKLAVPGQ